MAAPPPPINVVESLDQNWSHVPGIFKYDADPELDARGKESKKLRSKHNGKQENASESAAPRITASSSSTMTWTSRYSTEDKKVVTTTEIPPGPPQGEPPVTRAQPPPPPPREVPPTGFSASLAAPPRIPRSPYSESGEHAQLSITPARGPSVRGLRRLFEKRKNAFPRIVKGKKNKRGELLLVNKQFSQLFGRERGTPHSYHVALRPPISTR